MERSDVVELVGGIYREVVDGARYERFDRYFAADLVDHTPMGDAQGREAFLGFLDGFRAALPDFRHEVADVTLLADDLVTWRVRVTATFSGTFMGVAGNGQPVNLYVVNAARLRDGKVVEHWSLGPESLAEMFDQMEIQPPVPA